MTLDEIVDEHSVSYRKSLCTCGWEGENFTTHIIDVLATNKLLVEQLKTIKRS